MKKGVKSKKRERSEADNMIFFIGVLFFFFITFFVSYSFANEYVIRKTPVTAQDEASGFSEAFNKEQDLNNLYKEQNKNSDHVPILGFHQIRNIEPTDTEKEKLFITSPENFERQIKYLKDNGYNSISLTEYINYLENKIPLPKNSIVITFDDGYASQYDNAYPVLKKYGMIGVFFIYSDCIDKYPICMTSSQLKEISLGGMKLANHTIHHAFLTEYKDKTIKKEIEENEEYLKNITTTNFEKVLAYPYGVTDDRVIKILKDLDYAGAVGVSFYAKDYKNVFNLPRYLLGDNMQNFYNALK